MSRTWGCSKTSLSLWCWNERCSESRGSPSQAATREPPHAHCRARTAAREPPRANRRVTSATRPAGPPPPAMPPLWCGAAGRCRTRAHQARADPWGAPCPSPCLLGRHRRRARRLQAWGRSSRSRGHAARRRAACQGQPPCGRRWAAGATRRRWAARGWSWSWGRRTSAEGHHHPLCLLLLLLRWGQQRWGVTVMLMLWQPPPCSQPQGPRPVPGHGGEWAMEKCKHAHALPTGATNQVQQIRTTLQPRPRP